MSTSKLDIVPTGRICLMLHGDDEQPLRARFALQYGEAWGVDVEDIVILTHGERHPELANTTWDKVRFTARFKLAGWEYHLEEEDGKLFAVPEGEAIRADAIAQYACDDITVDDDAAVEAVEDGYWIDARVWVAREDDE